MMMRKTKHIVETFLGAIVFAFLFYFALFLFYAFENKQKYYLQ